MCMPFHTHIGHGDVTVPVRCNSGQVQEVTLSEGRGVRGKGIRWDNVE